MGKGDPAGSATHWELLAGSIKARAVPSHCGSTYPVLAVHQDPSNPATDPAVITRRVYLQDGCCWELG